MSEFYWVKISGKWKIAEKWGDGGWWILEWGERANPLASPDRVEEIGTKIEPPK